MNRSLKLALTALALVLVSIFLFSAYKLYDIINGYKTAEASYNDMSNNYVSELTPSPVPESAPEHAVPESVVEASPINVDFPSLLASCQDIVGWIYSPDTVINYPVVISTDNAYYLHRLTNGSSNSNGSIFVDYRCARDFSDKNTIIYGHHMNDGSMFASLVNYKNQAYYDAHPVMYLNTPNGNYKVEVFSAYVTSHTGSAYTMAFADEDTFVAFAAKMKTFSEVNTDVSVGYGDRIICLSTCTYEYNEARFVVFGKLVPIQ